MFNAPGVFPSSRGFVFNHPGGSFSIIPGGRFQTSRGVVFNHAGVRFQSFGRAVFHPGGSFFHRGVSFFIRRPREQPVRQAILSWGCKPWKLHSRRGRGRKIRATICGADFLGNCSIWGDKKSAPQFWRGFFVLGPPHFVNSRAVSYTHLTLPTILRV